MRRLTALVLSIAISAAPATSAFAESIRDRQYWLEQYGFVSAWEISKGEGVKVAVIDTGIDASHPALVGQVVGGFDVSGIGTYDGQTPIGQNSYHGTMVASLIAGREGTEGIVGVAPESELLSVSMAFGVDGLDTDSQIAKAIIWSVDNGAKVINLSLTRNSTSWPKSWDEAFLYAFEKDVVVVAAVGNSADGTEQISAPATIPGVVSVAGLDKNGIASTTQSLSGFTIAVTAPAEQLVGAYPGGEYRLWSGTSGAAPIVSGLVALIRSAYPELDSAGVIKRLLDSSSKFGFEGYSTSYGYGAINAEAALSGEYDTAKENPLGSLAKWIELYRTGTDSEQAGQIVTPFDDDVGPLEPREQTLSNGQAWLPIALYAGVGLFGLFLYFTFRPQRRGQVTR